MPVFKILALLCAFLSFSCFANAADDGKLLKVVALSRHGVRAPTQHEKTLDSWTQKTWPAWPVAKGELTPRGARLVTAMWTNMRAKFDAEDLLPKNECPAKTSVFARADTDERTRATARALLDGLAPGCDLGYAVLDAEVDPLFHPVKAGLYRFNPVAVATDVLSMTDGGLEDLNEDFAGSLALMNQIVGPPSPNLCARFTLSPNCLLSELPNAISVAPDGKNIRLVGGLAIASSIAEIFLLEYGEWPEVNAGWGQVNASALSQLMPVHAKIFDVVNRAPTVAWARGSSLLTEIAAALKGDHADPRCNEAKFVVFVGHDTNIANVGGLLGLNWRFSGYPENGIPPASVILFELWEINGKRVVRTKAYAQPPKALHAPFEDGAGEANAATHAPVETAVTAPPAAGRAAYDLDAFIRKVNQVTSGAPLAPQIAPPLRYSEVRPKP